MPSRLVTLVIVFFSTSLFGIAQENPSSSSTSNEWTWMGGSNTSVSPYGYNPPSSNFPSARAGSVSWTDTHSNFWLFGGFGVDSVGNGGDLNELWEYNSQQNWTLVSAPGIANQPGVYGTQGTSANTNMPGARAYAASSADHSGNLWLFGGNGFDSSATSGSLNDLWEFNPSTGLWTWVSGSNVGNQIGVYGTIGTPATTNVPGARNGAAIWTDSNNILWLFGGYGIDSNGATGILSDLWAYNPATGMWAWVSGSNSAAQAPVYGTQGVPSSGNTPGGRAWALSWIDRNNNLWLFGGGTNFSSDLWEYSPAGGTASGTWTWMSGSNVAGQAGIYGTQGVPATTNVPGARQEAVTWIDGSGDFWLFGGKGNDSLGKGGDLNDLWLYNPGANTWTWVSGSNIAEQPGVYGVMGTPALTNVPGGRIDSVGWIDSQANLWLFGGGGDDSKGCCGYLNDLWRYTPQSPNQSTGTIVVSTNLPSSSFTITGSGTYTGSGTSYTLANVAAGAYTITYGAVLGYVTPTPQMQTLASGGTLTFTGMYNPASVSPGTLTFPDTNVGAASSAQRVTLTNVSTGPLVLGTVVASTNFSVGTSTCGTSLAAGASCRINVQFRPTVAGPIIGTLTVSETSPLGSEIVTLSGNGIGLLTVTPNVMTFPDTSLPNSSSPQQIILANDTNQVIAFQTVSKPTAQFFITASGCGASLGPLSSCNMFLAFRPAAVASYSGALTITETSPSGQQAVQLSGNGISGGIVASTNALSLPDTNMGATSAASLVTLTNDTGGPVMMGPVAASQGFVVSNSTCSATLAPRQKCNVYVKFQPNIAGTNTGTLTINETAPAGSQVIALSGVGLNLVPRLTREYPKSVAAGSPGFVLNVYGSNFVSSSFVLWNGSARPTSFINSGQLQVQIPASDITFNGTANLTVATPTPGGGISSVLSFTAFPNGTACTSPIVIDPSPADCVTALVEDTTTDQQPLGTRIPLILIHGINGNQDSSGTDDILSPNRDYFLSFLNYFNYPGFQQKYKIYRFHYESNKYSTWEIGRSLRNQIDVITSGDRNWEIDTSTQLPKQIIIVAHSMGGLIAREYMNEHNTNWSRTWGGERAGYRISELVTLATPHHGTPVANGSVRTTGQSSGIGAVPYIPDWNALFAAVDAGYWGSWQFLPGSETNPNRSDLRFDNFNNMWSVTYTTDGTPIGYSIFEHNTLLDEIDHTFDNKIYAYYGYIGASTDVGEVGLLPPGVPILPGGAILPGGLFDLLIQRKESGDMDALLDTTGVILQRIWTANYDLSSNAYPITYLDNDGVVPRSSAAFDGATVMGQVECPGYDHFQMIGDDAFAPCKTGYTVLRSLVDTLGVP